MRRIVKSGKVVEKSEFPLGLHKPRRTRKKGSSSYAKKDQNLNQAIRRCARILNCNCSMKDLFITLTYDPKLDNMPDGYKTADKNCSLFLRRLTRMLQQEGIKFRYVIWVTADKDEKTGAEVRLHHHIVVKPEGFQIESVKGKVVSVKVAGKSIQDIWGKGFVDVRPLKDQDDYTPLAAYLVRQAACATDAKKWHTARGLEQPVVKEEVVLSFPQELRAPGGVDVKEISRYDAETGTHYIRYVKNPQPKTAEEVFHEDIPLEQKLFDSAGGIHGE